MGRGRRVMVFLTSDQREKLEGISRNGHAPTKKILHAQVLLMCDESTQAKQKW
ncbi:MAG: IS630 family transposase, partial [Moorea sp. SIO3I7]|nr:IS630 family transposase [Moorena sp. SIO3I7]NEN97944.1 IS630 family transposase [Moorena sp. SIO3I7]NEN98313.1 IS630 family transposase [Moorena sp. SIO3I7]